MWQPRSRLETSKALTVRRTFSLLRRTRTGTAGLSGIADLDKLCPSVPFLQSLQNNAIQLLKRKISDVFLVYCVSKMLLTFWLKEAIYVFYTFQTELSTCLCFVKRSFLKDNPMANLLILIWISFTVSSSYVIFLVGVWYYM